MIIREFITPDLPEIISVFQQTILTTNTSDYTPKQVIAWSGINDEINLNQWNQNLLKNTTLVAIEHHKIIGFADMTADGYLDHLFVASNHQHKGIATSLVNQLKSIIKVDQYSTASSITARPFFEKIGFKTIKKQTVSVRGEKFINYLMCNSAAKTYQYDTDIVSASDNHGGSYVIFPFDIKTEFGHGRVKVHATFDNFPYDGSIVNMGVKNSDGSICYVIGITKSIQKQINKSAGDSVSVTIEELC